MQNSFQFSLAIPEILLLIMVSGILLIDAFSRSAQKRLTYVLSLVSLAILMLVTVVQWGMGTMGVGFHGLYVVDPLAHLLKLLSYVAVFATLIYGRDYAAQRGMFE